MNLGYTHNKQCQVSFTLGWGLFGVKKRGLKTTGWLGATLADNLWSRITKYNRALRADSTKCS